MKKQILTFSLALALMPAFADDISQNLSRLNAAKLLVDDGCQDILSVTDSQKENARTALSMLQNLEVNEDAENFEKIYFAVSAKAALLMQDYKEVISFWNQAEEKGDKAVSEELKYFAAVAYYESKDFEKTITLLADEKADSLNRVYYEQKSLLASAYVKSGNLAEASKVYELLLNNKHLSEAGALDYGRILYNQKNYKKAARVVSGNKSQDALMILGGCALSEKKFAEAASIYANCSGTDALYFRAYAEYKNGKYSDAGLNFDRYVIQADKNPRTIDACYLAVQSYLLAGDYKKAKVSAEKYVEEAVSDSEKEKAVVLLSDIYIDTKETEKAETLLNKYAKQNKAYSDKCLYKLAVLQASSGKIKAASDSFAEVYKRFPVSIKAEESLYRSGEVYYLEGYYSEAAPKCRKYFETYAKGSYVDQAMYYEFDCLVKTKDTAKALLAGNRIVTQYSSSRYVDDVLEKLYELNYQREDYRSACEAAEKLFERKGRSDSALEKKIAFMKKILAGGNKELVRAELDYESVGGKNTVEGREKGTELAGLYVRDSESKEKGIKLAAELLLIQEKDVVNEREGAAANALILAEYFYEENRKAEAAEKYLKAAEYSRLNGDDEKAAFSLYTATECFVHLGKKGDANETAALLKQLYPESKYSTAVRSLLK